MPSSIRYSLSCTHMCEYCPMFSLLYWILKQKVIDCYQYIFESVCQLFLVVSNGNITLHFCKLLLNSLFR